MVVGGTVGCTTVSCPMVVGGTVGCAAVSCPMVVGGTVGCATVSCIGLVSESAVSGTRFVCFFCSIYPQIKEF